MSPGVSPRPDVRAVPGTVARLWPVASAIAALAVVGILAAVIAARPDRPFGIDLAWMDAMLPLRSPAWTGVAIVFNDVGGGMIAHFVIPIMIVILFVLFRRPWATVYYAVAALVSVGLVQLLKQLVGRARPPEMIVHSDFGSFPSGHTANATTTVVVLAIVFARTWIWIAGAAYTLLMMASRTYLGAHWLSDTVAALLLGAAIALLIWALLARRLRAERQRKHAALWVRAAPPPPTL